MGALRPLAALAFCFALAPAALAQDANDNLNAVLWMQKSVEYKANAEAVFALARIRLDEALKDKSRTAAPAEQTGDFKDLTPAVIADADETVIDNSGYQAWMVANGETFNPKTWTKFVNSQTSAAVPGAVEFAKYAQSKGVRVFYVTNRTKAEEPATLENMRKLGFPLDANIDTILTAKEQPDWGSAKGTRRAAIAKHYRILLLIGDNFGDFTDKYKGSVDERQKVYEENAAHWGKDWLMLPNPSYGSFESAPFGGNFKLPIEEQRTAKRGVLAPWSGQ